MGIFSVQLCYCNACGDEIHQPLPNVMGRTWRVCSLDCAREMQWRESLSIMGKPYSHDPRVVLSEKK